MKNRRSLTIFTTIFSVLACGGLAFVEVSPAAPDSFVASNTFDGASALANVTSGGFNSAFGWFSLFGNTDAFFNTGAGAGTLALNNGADNTAVGAGAMLLNTTGTDNVAVGVDALVFNDIASFNTAVGSFALFNNDSSGAGAANGNTAVGDGALFANVDGVANTAIGAGALSQNIIGDSNIALGRSAGSQVTGDNNIDIGNSGEAAETDTIRIGNSFHTATFIAGILGNGPFACSVTIDPVTGQLGVGGCISSERFKKDIDSMDKASEVILSLRPVTFHYKTDTTAHPSLG